MIKYSIYIVMLPYRSYPQSRQNESIEPGNQQQNKILRKWKVVYTWRDEEKYGHPYPKEASEREIGG